jgi:hypothetical protein
MRLNAVHKWIVANCRFAMSIQEARRILNVSPIDDLDTIRSAYRKLTLKYHPDKCPTAPCREEMVRINAAYDILRSNPPTQDVWQGPDNVPTEIDKPKRSYYPFGWNKQRHQVESYIYFPAKTNIEASRSAVMTDANAMVAAYRNAGFSKIEIEDGSEYLPGGLKITKIITVYGNFNDPKDRDPLTEDEKRFRRVTWQLGIGKRPYYRKSKGVRTGYVMPPNSGDGAYPKLKPKLKTKVKKKEP